MIVLVAVVAAMYATAQITLAPVSLVLLPGILEFKLSDVFTMAFGALFGPAGAWGVGVGNTIGDLFTGNLAVGSIFGFLSSLTVAYVGYTLFRPVERSARGGGSVEVDHGRSVALYLAVGILGAVVSAVSLAWGLELLGIAPYKVVSDALVGNFILGSWVGAVLYFALAHRLGGMGLTWTSLMDARDIGKPISIPLGVVIVTVGAFAAWILGAFVLPPKNVVAVVGVIFACMLAGLCLL